MQLKPGHDGTQIRLAGILHANKAIEPSGWSDPRQHSAATLRGKSPSHATQSGQRCSGLLDGRERGEDVADVEIQEVAKAADMPPPVAYRHGGAPRNCIELPAEDPHGPYHGRVEFSGLDRRFRMIDGEGIQRRRREQREQGVSDWLANSLLPGLFWRAAAGILPFLALPR
jgi:hypothetical protein